MSGGLGARPPTQMAPGPFLCPAVRGLQGGDRDLEGLVGLFRSQATPRQGGLLVWMASVGPPPPVEGLLLSNTGRPKLAGGTYGTCAGPAPGQQGCRLSRSGARSCGLTRASGALPHCPLATGSGERPWVGLILSEQGGTRSSSPAPPALRPGGLGTPLGLTPTPQHPSYAPRPKAASKLPCPSANSQGPPLTGAPSSRASPIRNSIMRLQPPPHCLKNKLS